MTGTLHHPPVVDTRRRWRRAGGVASLVAAATFLVGIAMFATVVSDYTTGDPTPHESVEFLVAHQGTLVAWHLVILIVFGVALVPLALTLDDHLRDISPLLARVATVFGLIWAGLVLATGMVANIGIEVVADLADSDPQRAPAVWSSIDAVTNGLGGGNELLGAIWIALVSTAARRARRLPAGLTLVGLATGVAGLATLIPAFETAEMVFGLGSIAWFAWLGVTLVGLRRGSTVPT